MLLLVKKKNAKDAPNLHTGYIKIASTYVSDLDHDLDVHMQSTQDLSMFIQKSTEINMNCFCALQCCGLLCKNALSSTVPMDF